MRGWRANTEDEKLRTTDLSFILKRRYWVTDDPSPLIRVENVSPDNIETWMPKVWESVRFYDRLVSSFTAAHW
ncbi:MAG: hypothetical protein ABIU29_06415 [Chthoniobacterales bacterium]